MKLNLLMRVGVLVYIRNFDMVLTGDLYYDERDEAFTLTRIPYDVGTDCLITVPATEPRSVDLIADATCVLCADESGYAALNIRILRISEALRDTLEALPNFRVQADQIPEHLQGTPIKPN